MIELVLDTSQLSVLPATSRLPSARKACQAQKTSVVGEPMRVTSLVSQLNRHFVVDIAFRVVFVATEIENVARMQECGMHCQDLSINSLGIPSVVAWE